MIKELQKRPFARPLLFWVIGILAETQFSCHTLSFLLLVMPVGILLVSLVKSEDRGPGMYGNRWIGGLSLIFLLLFLSIQSTFYGIQRESREQSYTSLRQWGEEKRQSVLQPFGKLDLSDSEKSVLATITLGYRATMDREVKKRFSMAGVAHILAVSGFHVAIVCGFLSLFFSVLPGYGWGKWIRYVGTIGLLWVFVFISGMAASALRAGLMSTLFLTGQVLERPGDRYNTLAASAFCMLAYKPLYLFDIGFQLSYLAVFSILLLQPRIRKWISVRNPLLAVPWNWIAVSLAAQIGTVFLCLYYFGQFSSVFLLANLPLTLIATCLIPITLVWMFLPGWFPGYECLKQIIEVLTRSLLWIVDSFSCFSFSTFTFRFGLFTMLGGYGMLFLLFLFLFKKRPCYLLAALSLLLIGLIGKVIDNFYAL